MKSILSALIIGIVLGGGFVYLYMDRAQVTVDTRQVVKDNEKASEIKAETVSAKESSVITKTIIKWKTKPPVEIPKELSDEEINTMCTNHYAPTDVVQSVRSEAAKAWARFNDL